MLVQKSQPSNLTYIAEYKFGRLEHKMDHLVRVRLELSKSHLRCCLFLNKKLNIVSSVVI